MVVPEHAAAPGLVSVQGLPECGRVWAPAEQRAGRSRHRVGTACPGPGAPAGSSPEGAWLLFFWHDFPPRYRCGMLILEHFDPSRKKENGFPSPVGPPSGKAVGTLRLASAKNTT